MSSTRTRLEREFDPAAVRRLKASSPTDITVGGPALAGEAIAAGLVDEIQLLLGPILVGGGKRRPPRRRARTARTAGRAPLRRRRRVPALRRHGIAVSGQRSAAPPLRDAVGDVGVARPDARDVLHALNPATEARASSPSPCASQASTSSTGRRTSAESRSVPFGPSIERAAGRPRIRSTSGLTVCSSAVGSPRIAERPLDHRRRHELRHLRLRLAPASSRRRSPVPRSPSAIAAARCRGVLGAGPVST